MSAEAAPTVRDVPERSRFEVFADGRTAGFVDYHLRPGRITLIHTEVADEFEGRGFARKLAVGALDDARRRALRLVPLCPFVASTIARPPEYEDLRAPDYVDSRNAGSAEAR